MVEQFAGFFSYSRFDDEHHSHLLTAIRKHVEGEIRSLTGQPFDLFQDSESIKPGERWPEKLKEAVDASVVFVPVLTPSFLQSRWCRDEVERFVRREHELGRNDLILPIYLTPCPIYSAPLIADSVALTMQSHQWVDITAFRHDSAVERNLKVALDKLTLRIAELITSGAGSRTSIPTDATTTVIVVDPYGAGHHRSVADAVAAAPSGAKIEVRPGTYRGSLLIERPVDIVGVGEVGDVIIESVDAVTISVSTDARLSNLTIRSIGAASSAVSAAVGRLELDRCSITAEEGSGLEFHSLADPRVRDCRVDAEDGKGIVFRDRARGSVERCSVVARAEAVEILERAAPSIRGSSLFSRDNNALWVHTKGKGTIEDNDITSTAADQPSIAIHDGGDPTLRKNRITSTNSNTLVVHTNGKGTIEDNDITSTAPADRPSIAIRDGGDPTLRRNRITSTNSNALWVHTNGKGTIEDNHLRSRAREAVALDPTAECRLVGNHLFAPKGKSGVLFSQDGKSTVERNVTTNE